MQVLPVSNLGCKNFEGKFRNSKTLSVLLENADSKTVTKFEEIVKHAEKTNDNLLFKFSPEDMSQKTRYIDLYVENLNNKSRHLVKTLSLLKGFSKDYKLDNPLENFLPKLKEFYFKN